MKGLLMRVGIDQTYGNYNAPINPLTNDYLYMPIPQGKDAQYKEGMKTQYLDLQPAFSTWGAKNNVLVQFPIHLIEEEIYTHLDPDFENLTYGDQQKGRGSRVCDLEKGDFLAFFASFKPVSKCQHRLVYALYGIMFVDKVVQVLDMDKTDLNKNAHSRKKTPNSKDWVVFAEPERSGRFNRAIPIGEYREGSYRVTYDVLQAWGGLGVKNGFIQRSVCPPWFDNADKFIGWLNGHNVHLIANNWE
jgi:hypothetical protein